MPGGKYQNVLNEIEKRWDELTNECKDPESNRIALPNPFITPSNGIYHGDQFYWDTYFTVVGLIAADRTKLAKGMVDNLLHLVDLFGFVPMRNRMFNTGISQPPFLTTMIRLIYDESPDDAWLDRAMKCAEREYHTYWLNDDPTDEFADHRVYRNLSRYADHYLVDQTAEHESGWDMTSRFNNRALNILPVDLNSQLYKYETDFAWYFELHDKNKSDTYREAAHARQQTMNELMWNEKDGRFYDYDYVQNKQTRFVATSCYVPLWAELATDEQAEIMSKTLQVLEKPGGLVNTAIGSLPQKQWDYPNGWAPSQWLVVSGLRNYGYNSQAEDIANRWLSLVAEVFEETGEIWEKYDVVHQKFGKEGRYENQTGFGWTNAVCIALNSK